MKKLTFLAVALVQLIYSMQVNAQIVYDLAGGGTFGGSVTGSGTPATSVRFSSLTGLYVDHNGIIYFADPYGAGDVIYKLNPSEGLVYPFAGTSVSAIGDGGPATAASIQGAKSIYGDAANNIYVADRFNNRIRKINSSSGIITTVAGGGTSTLDNIPATDASIGWIETVFVDPSGNIYTGDANNKIRKIDATTGIITTIAGSGISINSGDGGPATNAGIAGPLKCIQLDASGNIYIIPQTADRVRKIDVAGIISTVAGGGSSLADGILATNALIVSAGFVVDNSGNIYIADSSTGYIRKVTVGTNAINTIAGDGTASIDVDGTPPLCQDDWSYMLYRDTSGNIYSSGCDGLVHEIVYSSVYCPNYHADSFNVIINEQCSGPLITATTKNYVPGLSVQAYFGDGQSSVYPLSAGCSGYATFDHPYSYSGTYTMKFVLFNGAVRIDSILKTYSYVNCNSINIKYYIDENNDCKMDSSEPYLYQPILTEVDSEGIAIDTISATAGLYYLAYGDPGTIYGFRPIITSPSGLSMTCPISGSIQDTLGTYVYNDKIYFMGLSCGSAGFDDAVNAVVPVTGIHDQWGNVYINNLYCNLLYSTVTLRHSIKYTSYSAHIYPTPLSITDSTITWGIGGMTATSKVIDLYYAIWDNPATGYLSVGDTVHSYYSIAPITGDVNPINNNEIIIDTVRAGVDPNEMSVTPSGCIPNSTQTLKYTISFENTGNDTAFNIYVMDTLSNNVDLKSMRIIMASAQMNTTLISTGGYNILKFDFPNINLLDSSHHGQCDGAVIYTINLKNGLPTGTTVFNHAGIFFDINAVVMTNTVENIIGGCETAVPVLVTTSKVVSIYPNPTNETLTIKSPQDAYTTYTITNSVGQVLLQNELANTRTTVDVKTLASGLYYITLRGTDGTVVQKFVKM